MLPFLEFSRKSSKLNIQSSVENDENNYTPSFEGVNLQIHRKFNREIFVNASTYYDNL